MRVRQIRLQKIFILTRKRHLRLSENWTNIREIEMSDAAFVEDETL